MRTSRVDGGEWEREAERQIPAGYIQLPLRITRRPEPDVQTGSCLEASGFA